MRAADGSVLASSRGSLVGGPRARRRTHHVAGRGPRTELVLGAEDNRLIAYDPATGQSAVALGSAADDPGTASTSTPRSAPTPPTPATSSPARTPTRTTARRADAPGWGYLQPRPAPSLDDLDVTMDGNLVPTYVNARPTTRRTTAAGSCPTAASSPPTSATSSRSPPPPGSSSSGSPTPVLGFTGTDVAVLQGRRRHPHRRRHRTSTGRTASTSPPTARACPTNARPRRHLPLHGPADGLDGRSAAARRRHRRAARRRRAVVTQVALHHRRPARRAHARAPSWRARRRLLRVERAHRRHRRVRRRRPRSCAGSSTPPLLNALPPYPRGTPFGMAVDDEGSLWYADIGVELTLPAHRARSTATARCAASASSTASRRPPRPCATASTFPDGLGLVPLVDAAPAADRPVGHVAVGLRRLGHVRRQRRAHLLDGVPDRRSTQLTARTLVPAWIVPHAAHGHGRRRRSSAARSTSATGAARCTRSALADGGERWRFQTAARAGRRLRPDRVVGRGRRRRASAASPGASWSSAPGRASTPSTPPTARVVWVLDRSMGLPDTPDRVRVVAGRARRHRVRRPRHPQPAPRPTPAACGAACSPSTPPPARCCGSSTPSSDQPGVGLRRACGRRPRSTPVEGTVLLATGNCSADAVASSPGTPTPRRSPPSTSTTARWRGRSSPTRRTALDLDFGATPNVITLPGGGRRLIGIGNKDATYYAVDPATGALVWSHAGGDPGQHPARTSPIGGFIGSTATWRGNVFGAHRPRRAALVPRRSTAPTVRAGGAAVAGPSYAASAVVNGVVFTGDLTGLLQGLRRRRPALPAVRRAAARPDLVGAGDRRRPRRRSGRARRRRTCAPRAPRIRGLLRGLRPHPRFHRRGHGVPAVAPVGIAHPAAHHPPLAIHVP